MPPALSDEENSASGEEEIPYRGKGNAEEPEAEEEEEEEGGEGGEDDEYVVEKILSHKAIGGEILYEVKWQGYEARKDRTWEPEDNLSGALEILHEYWDSIGGRPNPKTRKRKGRKSAAEPETSTPVNDAKRARKEKEWSPPPGSWEHDVAYVDTVEESIDSKTGNPTRYAYLVWNNRRKTQHPLVHVNQKCPQKMLAYYESHLVFTHHGDDGMNGDNNDILGEEP